MPADSLVKAIPIGTPVERSLGASRLFAGLDHVHLAPFARATVRKRFKRGETIWHAGDRVAHATIIAVGLVKIVERRAEGPTSIVGIFGPHECIGPIGLVSGVQPADAVAATPHVEVLFVDRAPLLAALPLQPALSRALQLTLVEHCEALQHKIRVMSAGCVERRLATLLLYLAERFGDVMIDGRVAVPVALSRSELAALIGATVETTIRAMRRWEREGIVATTHDGFSIGDPTRLRAAS
jgi:CRP-like cAMP-binding protein